VAGVTAEPIVALDVPDATAAMEIVDRLGTACRFYKVGSELFTGAGPAVVRALRDAGCDVFLDLKYHDIPTTVEHAAHTAADLGVRLLTVHAAGGRAMLERAVAGAGSSCGVLGVTVLTSLDRATLAATWGREQVDLRHEVLRLAGEAGAAGVHGVVCSGWEVAAVRDRFGDALRILVPGIRLEGGTTHDQARVMTPAAAAAAGASYLVLGRAVTQAADPLAAMETVRAAIR
jgi:orotidine-5'-phosphate decarboxylase